MCDGVDDGHWRVVGRVDCFERRSQLRQVLRTYFTGVECNERRRSARGCGRELKHANGRTYR